MKCIVFESETMGAIPIAECGGLVLQKSQKLIVKETLGEKMKTVYGKRLIRTGQCEMDSLRNGSYQIVGDIAEFDKPKQEPAKQESPLAVVSSDRSMENVGNKE